MSEVNEEEYKELHKSILCSLYMCTWRYFNVDEHVHLNPIPACKIKLLDVVYHLAHHIATRLPAAQ